MPFTLCWICATRFGLVKFSLDDGPVSSEGGNVIRVAVRAPERAGPETQTPRTEGRHQPPLPLLVNNSCLPSACEYVLFFDLYPIRMVLPGHAHLSFRNDSFQITTADFAEKLFSRSIEVLRVQQPWTDAPAYQFTEQSLTLDERGAS